MSQPPKSKTSKGSAESDGEFPLGAREYFFYLLFQAARQRDLFCDKALSACGLNMAQWRSLAIVRRLEVCTMTSLARYSTVERTTLTRAVDQLVGRGLVSRWVPDRDRRQVNLSLTDQGEELFLRAVSILDAHNAQLLDEVPPDRLRDAMALLQANLRKLAGSDELAMDLLNFGRAEPRRG